MQNNYLFQWVDADHELNEHFAMYFLCHNDFLRWKHCVLNPDAWELFYAILDIHWLTAFVWAFSLWWCLCDSWDKLKLLEVIFSSLLFLSDTEEKATPLGSGLVLAQNRQPRSLVFLNSFNSCSTAMCAIWISFCSLTVMVNLPFLLCTFCISSTVMPVIVDPLQPCRKMIRAKMLA